MEKLIQLTLEVRQLEESLQVCKHLKNLNYAMVDDTIVKGTPFASAVLTTAYNKLREARMLLGDLLRLVGIEDPYNNAYIGKLQDEKPKYLQGNALININWEEVLSPDGMPHAFELVGEEGKDKRPMMKKRYTNHSLCLAYCKSKLGAAKDSSGYFYQLIDMKKEIQEAANQKEGANPAEFLVYFQMAAEALKLANCYLGLRFGELV